MSVYRGRLKAREWATPALGDRVSTPAGIGLGTVGAVSENAFRVDGDCTLWLSTKAVFTSIAGELTVICEPGGLARLALFRSEE